MPSPLSWFIPVTLLLNFLPLSASSTCSYATATCTFYYNCNSGSNFSFQYCSYNSTYTSYRVNNYSWESCTNNCCDSSQTYPQTYSSLVSCYGYSYSSSSSGISAYAVIIIVAASLTIFGIILYCCCRKCRQRQQDEEFRRAYAEANAGAINSEGQINSFPVVPVSLANLLPIDTNWTSIPQGVNL